MIQTQLSDAPKHCPPPGISVKAEYLRVRDADTVEWCVPGSAFKFASRLIGVWAPETDSLNLSEKTTALRGKEWVHNECLKATRFDVFIPFIETKEPLKALTFDRIPSFIYLDDELLNKRIVASGFAASEKGKALGT